MTWRRKGMWAMVGVLLVGLVVVGTWWWGRPAPLPKEGMLGKELVRYRKVDDKLDYTKVKESRCRYPRTPEQVVYESFVAINNNDQERFKCLTVGRKELGKELKITEDELCERMMCLGRLPAKHSGISLSYIVQHQDDWFAIMVFDPKDWETMVPLSLTRQYGIWHIDLSDLGHKQGSFAWQTLNDKALLKKLK